MNANTNALPGTPRIRYTIGPDALHFGGHDLQKGVWCGPVSNELAGEAVRPGRVQEYGFEQVGYLPPPAPESSPAPSGGDTFNDTDSQE